MAKGIDFQVTLKRSGYVVEPKGRGHTMIEAFRFALADARKSGGFLQTTRNDDVSALFENLFDAAKLRACSPRWRSTKERAPECTEVKSSDSRFTLIVRRLDVSSLASEREDDKLWDRLLAKATTMSDRGRCATLRNPSLKERVNAVINSAASNASDTVYVEKAAPKTDYARIALGSLRDLLSSEKDGKVTHWFRTVGFTW